MSRAALLLQKELWKIENGTSPFGVMIELIRNSLFHWKCTLLGAPNSSWEGGVFALELIFSQEYNEMPPLVAFTTVPFHPNICIRTGKPCVDFLDDPELWQPNTSILMLLVQLQSMLDNPVLENAVNPVAADMYKNSPRLYEQILLDSVISSRRIHAGLSLAEDDEKPLTVPPTRAAKSARFELTLQRQAPEKEKTLAFKLSYDKYYQSWKTIGTSVPSDKPVLLGNGIFKPNKLFAFGREKLNQADINEIMEKFAHSYAGKQQFGLESSSLSRSENPEQKTVKLRR